MSDAFNQMLAQGPTPIKIENPVNQMAQLMQLKNAQQTGVVNQMAIDKGQRALDTENAVKALYAGGATPTTNQLFAVSQEAGVKAQELEAKKALDSSTMSKNDAMASEYKRKASVLAMQDHASAAEEIAKLPAVEQQAAWSNWRESVALDPDLGPEIAKNIPVNYSLETSQSVTGRAKEVREENWKQKQYVLDERRISASEMSAAAARDRAANAPTPLAINKVTIRDPKNPDRSIVVNANLPQTDPNYVIGEAPEPVSASNIRIKKIEANEAKQAGKQLVDNIIANLEQNAADLEEAGGLADTDKSAIENIGPFARSTKIGQAFGAMTGSKVQSILDIMKSNRLQLLNAMKTASGMSSKAVDSNQELKTWLDSFSKEGGSKQALLQILENLKSYGEGDTGGTKPPPNGQNKNNPNDPLGLF
jgi:hypothetical protein